MPRILVADDNTNIQKMVSLAFQERGVEVISVGNGEAAVRRVPDLNPDLILADIFMPVRNGYEVCEWIKKDQKYAHIPVILLVGAFDPLDEKEARRVGADGVLKKPFIPPDPLIAMVTATLEKNPKLAAELARAKEAAESPVAAPVHVAPTAPPPAAKVAAHIPAPIEVAPVTDDSTDDASLAYGFGAGHRDLDSDGQDESAAARAPKSEFEKAEEEFDGASTTSDWRRSAMSFEVSEEDSRRPAFSDEDLEPAPVEAAAETMVEPIVESMPAIEPLPGAVIDPTLEAEPAPLTEADLKAPDSWQILPDDAAVSGEGDQHSEWASDVPDVPSTPYPVTASESAVAAHEEPTAVVLEAVLETVPDGIRQEVREVVSEPQNAEPTHELVATVATPEPAPAEPIAPEPSFAAKASHWMDAMGSVSGQPQGDWLSAIHSQQNRAPQNAEAVNEPPVASVAEASQSNPLEEAAAISRAPESADAESATHAAPHAAEDTEKTVAEAVSSVEPVAQHVELHNDQSVSQEDEDWFFAEDEPQSAAVGEPAASAVASSSSEPVNEPVASRDNVFEATVSEPVAVSPSREETDFVEEEPTAPVASRDSQLIEPPAVHVTPEPLLVDEYSSKESDQRYGHTNQEIAPAYTFLPPVETTAEAASLSEQAREEESGLPSFGATDATHSSASPSDEDAVPSYLPPPPTREQLAHIPFLNPPPDDHKEAEKATDNGVAQFAVDAVVQRILEQIEPRLHDLLSQNLKPLIENLVHTEIQKHDH